jgi:hypothetical protein
VLKEPQPYFLELFTPSSMIVYSKKALDENNQDLRKVIAPGTGAFMFKERKVAEKWVMVRNPNYWDPEIPYLDGIELLHIPAWTDRGTAVLTGQADYSPNVSLETHQEGLKRKDIVGTVRYPGEFNSYQAHQQRAQALQRSPGCGPSTWRSAGNPIKASAPRAHRADADDVPRVRYPLGARDSSDIARERGLAEAKKLMAAAGVPMQPGADFVGLGRAARRDPRPRLQTSSAHARHRDRDPRMERALLIEELKKGTFDMMVQTEYRLPIGIPAGWEMCLKTGGS